MNKQQHYFLKILAFISITGAVCNIILIYTVIYETLHYFKDNYASWFPDFVITILALLYGIRISIYLNFKTKLDVWVKGIIGIILALTIIKLNLSIYMLILINLLVHITWKVAAKKNAKIIYNILNDSINEEPQQL